MLEREQVRQACDRALEHPGQLQEALEIIWRESFPDSGELAAVFAERAMAMYDELKQQLAACGENSEAWLKAQMEEAGRDEKHAAAILAGICAMAAALHKDGDAASVKELAASLEGACQAERISAMMNEYWQTPLQDLFFTWRDYPLLNEAQQRSAACLLAMLVYGAAKNNPAHEIAPDVSFDAVCILSGAAAEIRCRPEEDVRQELGAETASYARMTAAVCGLLCTQYLWLDAAVVCAGCIHSLVRGMDAVFRFLSGILKGMAGTDEGHVEMETVQGYDFDRAWEKHLYASVKKTGDRMNPIRRSVSEVRRHEKDYE